jgi:inorganic triphosphatase YgiF
MPTENEIKLVMTPPLLSRLRRHPLLKLLKHGRGSTHHLVSVYYDTPDHKLFNRNLALRVRQIGSKRIQTLKAQDSGVAGQTSREEWEREITSDQPVLDHVGDERLSDAIDEIRAGRRPLAPIFATHVRRTAWTLKLHDGSEVALALDEGEVKADGVSAPICEAEMELMSGAPESMFDLAAKLHGDIPFQLGNRSKSSRGYDMIAGRKPESSKSAVLSLKPHMTVETAFKAVARNCLAHLEANESSACSGVDPEGIHQMRVALRRLRSALGIFRAALPRQTAGELAGELRWLAPALGPARDWDVFRAETLAPIIHSLPNERGPAVLDERAAVRRGAAYEQARAAIGSPRYTDLKLKLAAWLVANDWSAIMPEAEAALLRMPVIDFADTVLRRRHRKLRKKGGRHRDLTLPELHALRICAKKMRYAADFFRRFYSRKRVKDYIAAVVALQESLGGINDAAAGRLRLAELGVGDDAVTVRAEAIVLGWLAGRVEEQRRRFDDVWRDFSQADPFWSPHPAQDQAAK